LFMTKSYFPYIIQNRYGTQLAKCDVHSVDRNTM